MDKKKLKKLIDVSAGRIPADKVIKNCKIVDVFMKEVILGDLAISDDLIAGIGEYEGKETIDLKGKYIAPGFIDGHIHIESSYTSPEILGSMLVPHGGTTIIADPHEIVNVKGIDGLDYMMNAAENTELKIEFMLPSCVPATSFEHSGAIIDSEKMKEPIKRDKVIGLGEFMNFPGVIMADDEVLNKLLVAKNEGKLVDGHCPNVFGNELNAYAAARIAADHECTTVEEMHDRIRRGMYVLMREGSACHELRTLLKGVTEENSRRCLLCSDDRQPKTILNEGHIDNHLRVCVEEGIDPLTAIRMASLNAAECFGLKDRGALSPGYKADIVAFDNLSDFNVSNVWIDGKLVAEDGKYLPEIKRYDTSSVRNSMNVKNFSKDRFKMYLNSNKVNAIEIMPGGVVTGKAVVDIDLDDKREFVRNPDKDIVKIAVVERHNATGNVACGFIKGYGIKEGAIALSIAHDSHNIIVTGVNDKEMEFAVNKLIEQEGGIVAVRDGEVLANMPMPIAGLMSDKTGEWVMEQLTHIHKVAHEELKVNESVEPVMTLCFMSLPVIPELKITDMGIFDVSKFSFIPVEAD